MNSDKKENLLNLEKKEPVLSDEKKSGILGLSRPDVKKKAEEESSAFEKALSIGAYGISGIVNLFGYVLKPFSEKGVTIQDAIKDVVEADGFFKKFFVVSAKIPQLLATGFTSAAMSWFGDDNEAKIKEFQKKLEEGRKKKSEEMKKQTSEIKKEMTGVKKSIESMKSEDSSNLIKSDVRGNIGIPVFDNSKEKPVSGGGVYANVYNKKSKTSKNTPEVSKPLLTQNVERLR